MVIAFDPGVLFDESDVQAWIEANGIPAERRKDADHGTGW